MKLPVHLEGSFSRAHHRAPVVPYRPGDQIDQHINPNLWPPLPLNGNNAGLWPQFPGRGSDFWAQGVNFGLEARW